MPQPTRSIRFSINVNLPLLLGVVFITLKLCGAIDWSWWWVLSPIWIPVLFWTVLLSVWTGVWWMKKTP